MKKPRKTRKQTIAKIMLVKTMKERTYGKIEKENSKKESETRKERTYEETEKENTKKEMGVKIIKEKDEEIEKNNYKKGSGVGKIKKKKGAIDVKKLCWSCSNTQKQLYKCSSCFKARYCSKVCLMNDWTEHSSYCRKMNEKLKAKKEKKEEIRAYTSCIEKENQHGDLKI